MNRFDSQERGATTAVQTGTVVGIITDAWSGNVIAGALVRIQSHPEIQATTDESGAFTLLDVPAGRRIVLAEHDDYEVAWETVMVLEDAETEADLSLEPSEAGDEAETQRVAYSVPADRQIAKRAFEPARMRKRRGRRASPPGVAYLQAPASPASHAHGARFAKRAARDYVFVPGRPPSYRHFADNNFRLTSKSPLSTFSIDVDRASYAHVRRCIRDGYRPPADAIRVEELINYFHYEPLKPSKEHPISMEGEVWDAPWKPEHRLVSVRLHAPDVERKKLPPSNLVFLIDVSGSMEGRDRLDLVKRSLRLLVRRLRKEDRVAIIAFDHEVHTRLRPTSGANGKKLEEAVDSLYARGGTSGWEGLRAAYEMAKEAFAQGGNNRIILCTDGDFNVGPSDESDMVRLVKKEREGGVYLTVLGFGVYNLQDSMLKSLSKHGNGNLHYLDGIDEARKALIEEMGGTLVAAAQDVKVQVEFNPKRTAGYRLIGYERRLMDAEDFEDDAKDAGEMGVGHSVTALYEVVPAGAPVPGRKDGGLRYAQDGKEASVGEEREEELLYIRARYKVPGEKKGRELAVPVRASAGSGSADLQFASAVAAFGMLLRGSPHVGEYSLSDVRALAEAGKGTDPKGYRGEFVRLVELTDDQGILEMKAPEEE